MIAVRGLVIGVLISSALWAGIGIWVMSLLEP